MNILDLIKKKSQAEAAMARQIVQRVKQGASNYFKPAPQVRIRDVVRELAPSNFRRNIIQTKPLNIAGNQYNKFRQSYEQNKAKPMGQRLIEGLARAGDPTGLMRTVAPRIPIIQNIATSSSPKDFFNKQKTFVQKSFKTQFGMGELSEQNKRIMGQARFLGEEAKKYPEGSKEQKDLARQSLKLTLEANKERTTQLLFTAGGATGGISKGKLPKKPPLIQEARKGKTFSQEKPFEALFKKSEGKLPSDGFVYHTTSPNNIKSISEKGLNPANGIYGKGVYFAHNPELTGGYGSSEGAMIRVKRSNLPKDFQEFPDQGFTGKKILPKDIEYSIDNGKIWKQVQSQPLQEGVNPLIQETRKGEAIKYTVNHGGVKYEKSGKLIGYEGNRAVVELPGGFQERPFIEDISMAGKKVNSVVGETQQALDKRIGLLGETANRSKTWQEFQENIMKLPKEERTAVFEDMVGIMETNRLNPGGTASQQFKRFFTNKNKFQELSQPLQEGGSLIQEAKKLPKGKTVFRGTMGKGEINEIISGKSDVMYQKNYGSLWTDTPKDAEKYSRGFSQATGMASRKPIGNEPFVLEGKQLADGSVIPIKATNLETKEVIDFTKSKPLQEGVTSSSTKPTSIYTSEQSIQNIGNRKPGQPATQGATHGMPTSPQTSIPPKNVSYNPNTNISTKNVNPRGFIETVRESNKPMGKVAQKVDSYYNTAFQKETLEAADRNIAKDFEGAVHRAKTEIRGTKEIQAESMRLMDELQVRGRTQDALDILEKVSERGTESGQASNILNAYRRLTPEGILMTAQRQIKKAKELNPNKYGNLKLKTEDAVRLRKMAEDIQGMAGEAKDTATRAMLEEIERLVPTPWARKVTTLWKAGLLTGVRGAVGGNTVGNTTMAVLRKVTDVPATAFDIARNTITGKGRSKVFTMKGLISGAWEGAREGISNMRKGIGANDLANKLDYNKVYFGKGALGKAAQKYTDTVFNFYSAADRPFYHSALKNNLYDLAIVEAKNRKLTGAAAKDFIEKIVKEPTDEISTQAVSAAQKAVFQGKNMMGSALSGLKKGMKKYGPVGEILSEGALPFPGVPSAIASAVHNYSPTGAIAGVYRAIVQAKNGGLTQSGRRALSEALGKGLTGTAAIWLGMKLTKSGQMTLGYPTDAGEKSLWEQEGKIPYAIKINGKWRSLNYMGPVMSLLSIGGEIQKADSKGVEAIVKGTLGSGKAILSSSPLQGMQAGMDAFTDPQRYGDSYTRNQASSIIPTLIKDFAVSGDPTQRESNTVGEAIRSKIPWMRNNLLPKRDIFGQEVPRNTSAIGSVIDPFRSSEARTNPLVNELRRLQDAGYGPTMSKLSKNQTIFGQKIQLNPQELDKLEQDNQRIKPLLEQIITSREYQALDDEERQKLINSVINDTRKESRESSAMGNNQPMIDTGKLPEKYQKEMQQKSLANDIISGGGVEAVKNYKPGTLTTAMINDLYDNGDIDDTTKLKLDNKVKLQARASKVKYAKALIDQDINNVKDMVNQGALTPDVVDDMFGTGVITGKQALAFQKYIERNKWETGQKKKPADKTYNGYIQKWQAKYGMNKKQVIQSNQPKQQQYAPIYTGKPYYRP